MPEIVSKDMYEELAKKIWEDKKVELEKAAKSAMLYEIPLVKEKKEVAPNG